MGRSIVHAAVILIASMMSLGSVLAVTVPARQNTESFENSAKTYNDLPTYVHRRTNRFLDTHDLANVAKVNKNLQDGFRRDTLPWNQQAVDDLAQGCYSDSGKMFKTILNWLAGNQQSRHALYFSAKDDFAVNRIVQCFTAIKELENPSGRTIPFVIFAPVPDSFNLTPLLKDFGPVRITLQYNEFFLNEEYLGALSEALIRYNSIEELTFYETVFDEQGLLALIEALKENKSLRRLSISTYYVSGDLVGSLAIAFAEALKVNESLEQLQIEHIPFGNEGAFALANGLKSNKVLQQLTLFDSEIGSEGAVALAEALKENRSLKQLSLQLNQIDEDGAVAIAEFLKQNENLRSLNLHSNPINSDGVVYIANALKENKGLRCLNLGYCNVGTTGARALAESLKANQSLERLFVDRATIDHGKRALAKVVGDEHIISETATHSQLCHSARRGLKIFICR